MEVSDSILRELARHVPIPAGGIQGLVLLLALFLGRSVPTLFLNPFLGGSSVPAQVKIGFALTLAVVVLPRFAVVAGPVPTGPAFLPLMMKEVAIGVTLGFLSSLPFHAVATAGRLIDTQRGSNMAEAMVFQLRERTSLLGQMFMQGAIVLFLVMNGHLMFLRGYMSSFDALPVTHFPAIGSDLTEATQDLIAVTARLLVIALQLGAPAVAAVLLVDAAFGLMNRFAPSVNVFFLSMPVKVVLGLIVVQQILSALFDQFQIHAFTMLSDLSRFVGYLRR